MALLLCLEKLATVAKSTMMVDQVLVLMEMEAEVIEELERFPWLRDNLEAVETARVLKRVQQRDIEKVTRL
ncbi:hypothetical protein Tco_0994531 [Tanacetum coccineum]